MGFTGGLSLLDWMSGKQGDSWQRDVCGWWAGEMLWFPWHPVLQPAESSLAYTWALAGHGCALHTATKTTEPVCGGFWITGCMGSCRIAVNSGGLCPSKWLIPSVWMGHLSGGFPKQCCTTVGSRGCEAKCAALRLVLCAAFTPSDISVSVSRTSAGVPLLGVSCGSCSHKPGAWRWWVHFVSFRKA